MKHYKAYLKQAGEGCDYTIECGTKVIDIHAGTIEEAQIILMDIIKTEYSFDELSLSKVELYEIENIISIDMKKFYKDLSDLKKIEKQKKQDDLDKKEFER